MYAGGFFLGVDDEEVTVFGTVSRA
jgi:hypothetical protein